MQSNFADWTVREEEGWYVASSNQFGEAYRLCEARNHEYETNVTITFTGFSHVPVIMISSWSHNPELPALPKLCYVGDSEKGLNTVSFYDKTALSGWRMSERNGWFTAEHKEIAFRIRPIFSGPELDVHGYNVIGTVLGVLNNGTPVATIYYESNHPLDLYLFGPTQLFAGEQLVAEDVSGVSVAGDEIVYCEIVRHPTGRRSMKLLRRYDVATGITETHSTGEVPWGSVRDEVTLRRLLAKLGENGWIPEA